MQVSVFIYFIFSIFSSSAACVKIDTRIQPACGDPNGFSRRDMRKAIPLRRSDGHGNPLTFRLPMYYEKINSINALRRIAARMPRADPALRPATRRMTLSRHSRMRAPETGAGGKVGASRVQAGRRGHNRGHPFRTGPEPRPWRSPHPAHPVPSLEAVARLRSEPCGEELCVTVSAVSHRLRQLESHLGVRLFSRSGHPRPPRGGLPAAGRCRARGAARDCRRARAGCIGACAWR